jgi:hypothetical protein
MIEKIKAYWKNLPYSSLWTRILILVTFVVGSICIFVVFSSKSPKSTKTSVQSMSIEKYNQTIPEKDYVYEIVKQGACNALFIEGPQAIKLVDIGNKTGNYESALNLLLTNIRKISKCNEENSGAISLDYKYESLLYQKLAETLKLKGDTKRAEQALVKSKVAEEMAAKLLVDEKKQQEKDLDRVLAK